MKSVTFKVVRQFDGFKVESIVSCTKVEGANWKYFTMSNSKFGLETSEKCSILDPWKWMKIQCKEREYSKCTMCKLLTSW